MYFCQADHGDAVGPRSALRLETVRIPVIGERPVAPELAGPEGEDLENALASAVEEVLEAEEAMMALVGWVDAPEDDRDTLEYYGIDLSEAHWDPETERWEGCRFSEALADMLIELYDRRDFPYQLEAGEEATTQDPA